MFASVLNWGLVLLFGRFGELLNISECFIVIQMNCSIYISFINPTAYMGNQLVLH